MMMNKNSSMMASKREFVRKLIVLLVCPNVVRNEKSGKDNKRIGNPKIFKKIIFILLLMMSISLTR